MTTLGGRTKKVTTAEKLDDEEIFHQGGNLPPGWKAA